MYKGVVLKSDKLLRRKLFLNEALFSPDLSNNNKKYEAFRKQFDFLCYHLLDIQIKQFFLMFIQIIVQLLFKYKYSIKLINKVNVKVN